MNWNQPNKTSTYDLIRGTVYKIIKQSSDRVEVSFTRTWNPSIEGNNAPLNIDKRFIMLNNSSGFYSYAIFEHSKGMPGFNLYEARIAFRLQKKFHYMAVSDDIQRYMPLPEDRLPGRSVQLDYKEAVLLVDPIEPQFKGQVDDKYQYACENKDCNVHGWICSNPAVGFWQISPSNEFKAGGPIKPDLTSHVGPTTLNMFVSSHYGGKDVALRFEDGEPWTKVFGPVFIYLNSVSDESKSFSLWNDAKNKMKSEVRSWPYEFVNSRDFLKSDQRGTVKGRLLVQDRRKLLAANGAYVGLAPPGESGSWQREGKGYQFWTTADNLGSFRIENVREGDYNLYAWVPGVVGDYHYNVPITVTSGYHMDMGNLIYKPLRFGPTLWEIGIPDRTAAEFYIPDPDPAYRSRLFVNRQRFKQYGLWDRYMVLYPNHDLVYTVGRSDYRKDWFFAHVNRKTGNHTYEATTWEIKFYLNKVRKGGAYNLLIAIAAANYARLQVRVNDRQADPPLFTSNLMGRDNAIPRHGIHGLHHSVRVEIPGARLVPGRNSIYITQTTSSSHFAGLMYDYIRLEGPYFQDVVQSNGYLD